MVDVKYDLGASTATSVIPIAGLTIEVPPDGTLSGSQTLRYTSDSGSGLATGPVQLISFNLYVYATAAYTSPYATPTLVTVAKNDLHIEFIGLTSGAPSSGQRLPGGTVTPLGAIGIFRVTGSMHCYNACALIGVPTTTTVPLRQTTFTAPLPSLTGAVGQPHTVYGTASDVNFKLIADVFNPRNLNVYGTTQIVGREVRRTPVPEPGSVVLLGVGIAALGLGGAAWGWRPRTPDA